MVLIVLFVGVAAYVAWRIAVAQDERARGAASSEPVAVEEGAGDRAPRTMRVIDASNLRFVDLRSLPADELAVGRFEISAPSLLSMPPVAAQIWIVPLAAVHAWLASGDTALQIILLRLSTRFTQPGTRAMLAVSEGALSDEEQKRIAANGMQVAADLTIVGSDRTLTLADIIAKAGR